MAIGLPIEATLDPALLDFISHPFGKALFKASLDIHGGEFGSLPFRIVL